MYSRYTPNASGGHDRHPVPPPHRPDPSPGPPFGPPRPHRPSPPPRPMPGPPGRPNALAGLLPGRLQKGDLLMLAILYLLLSEEDDKLLPLLAVGLYLILK